MCGRRRGVGCCEGVDDDAVWLSATEMTLEHITVREGQASIAFTYIVDVATLVRVRAVQEVDAADTASGDVAGLAIANEVLFPLKTNSSTAQNIETSRPKECIRDDDPW